MNMHSANTTFSTLPSGGRPRRVYRAPYTFQLGQPVLLGGNVWIVTGRSRSSKGMQLFAIYRHRDVRPSRVMMAHGITAVPLMINKAGRDVLLAIALELKGDDDRYIRKDNGRPSRLSLEAREYPRRAFLASQWSSLLSQAFRNSSFQSRMQQPTPCRQKVFSHG